MYPALLRDTIKLDLKNNIKRVLPLRIQRQFVVPVPMSQSRACQHGHKVSFHYRPSYLAFLMSLHHVLSLLHYDRLQPYTLTELTIILSGSVAVACLNHFRVFSAEDKPCASSLFNF